MKKTTFFKSILLAFAIMVGSVSAWGQIAALELGTASQSTNTTGAATFTSKDANIASLPGLTVTVAQQGQAGGNGYVASKAWNNANLTTTTYWQFTVAAATGYQLSVTALSLRMYRSSTGPGSIALATDADSYASTIGGVQTLASAAYSTITFSGLTLSNKSSITFRVYAYGASSATGTLRVGDATASSPDISVTGTVNATSASPTLSVTPSSLTGFAYVSGSGPSSEQSFTVGGTNLTNNISITAPTDYEISTGTGASFVATSPITLTQTGGTVATTTIYARLKAGLAVASYNSENIAVASTGATGQNVACSGSVTAVTPTITVSEVSVAAFSANIGSAPTKTINVSGTNLTGNITLALSGTNADQFSLSQTSLTQVGGTVSNTVITITYTPTSTGTHAATLTLSSTGAADVTRSLSGTAGLATPVASESSANNNSGFTANWSAVPGATDYVLSVYTKTGGGTPVTALSENFDLFSAGATGAGANTTDVSLTSMDALTQTPGWTGVKVYAAGGTVKMGSSSALGSITTPSIDLSANGGAFNVSFKSMAWSTDSTKIKIYLNDVLVKTVTGLTNDANYTLNPFSVDLTGGTATSKIRFEGLQAAKGRFFLEDLVISSGSGSTQVPVAGSPFTVTGTNSYTLTGLQGGSTYYYTVVAKNATVTTASSNEIIASTMATGLSSILNSLSVSASDGIIRFTAESGQVIELYNAVGQKLLIKQTTGGLNNIPVAAKGLVIVKVGNQIAKVIL